MPVMLRYPFQTLGVFCSPLPAAVGKFVQYVVLYCAHMPLYQSGIAGRSSRMYLWICEWIFFAAVTLPVAPCSA